MVRIPETVSGPLFFSGWRLFRVFFAVGRVRGHENWPVYSDFAAKCPKMPENLLYEYLPDRVRFGAFSFGSVRNAFFREITLEYLYLSAFPE